MLIITPSGSIIPHTQSVTTLISKTTGDVVNIECDIIAKYIEKLANKNKGQGKLDMNFLAGTGIFIRINRNEKCSYDMEII